MEDYGVQTHMKVTMELMAVMRVLKIWATRYLSSKVLNASHMSLTDISERVTIDLLAPRAW